MCLTEIKLSRISLPKPVATFIISLYKFRSVIPRQGREIASKIKTVVVPGKPSDFPATVDGNTGNQMNAHSKTAATAKVHGDS